MASSSVPMAEFYSGKNVLITGGTGFIGKAIIEKIVRCLPQIKKVVSTGWRFRDLCHYTENSIDR